MPKNCPENTRGLSSSNFFQHTANKCHLPSQNAEPLNTRGRPGRQSCPFKYRRNASFPIMQRLEPIIDEVALVQPGIKRPFGFRQAIFFRSHKDYHCRIAGLTIDYTGKVVLGNIAAFISCMIITVFIRFKSYPLTAYPRLSYIFW